MSQDVSFTLGHVIQFFFATLFPPSHPLVSSCLSSFFYVVDSDSVITVMLIEILSIKCCCIVMWQTNGIQCVRNDALPWVWF